MSVASRPGARREEFPVLIRPMLATAGDLPRDEAAYAAELKWDGARVVAYIRDGEVRLTSRNDLDVTSSYPELAAVCESVGGDQVVLDGEVVAFNEDGHTDF